MILLLYILFVSFYLTAIAVTAGVLISVFINKYYTHNIKLVPLAKRSFWTAWGANIFLLAIAELNNWMTISNNVVWICPLIVMVCVYINYNTLKKSYYDN